MSHYQKLALLAIRLAAVAFVGTGLATLLFGGVLGGLLRSVGGMTGVRFAALLPSLFYLAVGVLLYAASRPIAAMITRDI